MKSSEPEEVNQLWNEFKKQKAGAALVNKKTGATTEAAATPDKAASGETQTVSDKATATAEIEVVDLSMTVLPDEPEDPVEKAARQKSHAELDHIIINADKSLLLEALSQKIANVSQKVCCIVDAQTSRPKVNLDYIEMFKNFVAGHGLRRYSLAVIVGQRPAVQFQKTMFAFQIF